MRRIPTTIKDEVFKRRLLQGGARIVEVANELEDLDNLVEFIEGKKEEKAHRKKKKGKTRTKDKLCKVQNLDLASPAEKSEGHLEQIPENPINSQKPKNMSVEVGEDRKEVCLEKRELEIVLENKTENLRELGHTQLVRMASWSRGV